MSIYIRTDLVKGKKKDSDKAAAKNQQGEARGGEYAARLQIGYEKDGSPRYKYFKTLEERDKYLEKRGSSGVEAGERLKHKLNKEQKKSGERSKTGQGKTKTNKPLYVRDDKKSDDDKEKESKRESKDSVKKSIDVMTPLFIWRLSE